jgi:hypothetical protein
MEGIIMDTKILDELEVACSQELSLVGEDLGALEAAVKAKMCQLGQGLLQRLVQRKPNGYQGSSLACECGGSKRFVGHRSRQVHSIFGWIEIHRAYYHCPVCSSSQVPYDQASGLGSEQISPGLARYCCTLAVDDSFEQSSRKIQELLGQKVSANTIERLTQQVGKVLLERSDQQLVDFQTDRHIPDAQARAKRLYIAADGTTVHETDGWHESKIGVIYWENERQQRQNRYMGRFDNSEIFGWHLWLEACRCGLRQADEVVFLGDGAGWIRNERRKHFGRATFIIDWYHGSEHIWDCGKVLFGEGTDATEKWAKVRESWLWDGHTDKLLKDLDDLTKRHRGRKREELLKLHKYIQDNEQEMQYDVFRAKGYDIGSGSVEGACKHVVGKRLKQSGMTWNRSGSSAILALRIAWLNRQWVQLWAGKPLAA